MTLFIAGLRYQTASLNLREQVAFAAEELAGCLAMLKKDARIEEALILSTCNRTELIWTSPDSVQGIDVATDAFAALKHFDWRAHPEAVFLLENEAAIEHLFRVSAGLESLILGEGQIQAQIKEALRLGQDCSSVGLYLDRLCKAALSAGKRVRTETGITQRDASVSKAALDYALAHQTDLLSQPIAVIGGGQMAAILLKELTLIHGAEQVTLVNRSEERLRQLSEKFPVSTATWDAIQPVLQTVSTVFVATGAPHIVLGDEALGPSKERLVIDIAVPRNVDPEVANRSDIQLLDIDQLGAENKALQQPLEAMLGQAEAIIEEELQRFTQWQRALPAHETIKKLRHRVEALRQEELARYAHQPEVLPLLETITRNFANKLLHEPMSQLRAGERDQQAINRQAEILETLFNLRSITTDVSTSCAQPDATGQQSR